VAEIPDDVRARLLRDYPGETHFEAIRLIEVLDCTPRVLRAIVYLAAGDFEQLLRFARAAEADWRDVVFWAEYEEHGAEHPRRVRSMDEPLT
jgi:DNA polymerase III delta prime subunit